MGVIDRARSRRARRRALSAVALLGAVVLALVAVVRVGSGGPTPTNLRPPNRVLAVHVVCISRLRLPPEATSKASLGVPAGAPVAALAESSLACVAYRAVRVPGARSSPGAQARVNARALL